MVVIKKKVIRSFSLFFKLPIVNEGEWGKNKIWMKRILVYSANERKKSNDSPMQNYFLLDS